MYTHVDQRNLDTARAPIIGPVLGSSLLTSVDRPIAFRGHAIKYVLKGEERYTVNGRPFVVRSDHYLVANPHCRGHLVIDSASNVAGLCADLPNAFIDGMVTAFTQPDDLERTTLDHFFNSAEFLENVCSAKNTRVGAIMRRLSAEVHASPRRDHAVTNGLYLLLAEAFVVDHRSLVPLLRNVKAARTSTRKEALRGLERARTLIHDRFAHRIDVSHMAKEAAMSEFHFFRAFRAVHGMSPHRYLHTWRLEQAAMMLSAPNAEVTDVALRCGFADGAAFSKAFKKNYGAPPSTYLRRSRRI